MPSSYSRATVAEKLALATVLEEDGFSQRQQVACMDIPRSTWRDWQQRQAQIDLDPAWVAFFTSPAGETFLHRMMVALHLVLELSGAGGIRLVSRFLELTWLDRFVAPSYGTQHGMAMNVEEAVVAFGQEEGQRLGATMPARSIALCEDETFHPEPCLVAIEPVSDFIVLEQYAPDYTAATWTRALQAALGDWPVEVIQVTADEGRALGPHIKEELGVHHTSDLFHLQQAGVQATSAGLARCTRQAEKAREQAREQVATIEAAQTAYEQGPRPPGRPPDFARRLQTAQTEVAQAQQTLDTAQQQQEQAREARQGINQAYHPYELDSGAPRSSDTVEADLKRHLDTLERLVQPADLSDRCRQKVNKRRGSAIGGQLWAHESIRLLTAGSQGQAPTFLMAGVDQENVLKLDRMKSAVDGAYNQLRRLVEQFGMQRLDVGQIKNMIAAATGARRNVLANKARQLGQIVQTYQKLQTAYRQLEQQVGAQVQGAEIRICERAFPGVEIRLGEHRRQLTEMALAPHFRVVGGELAER